MMNDAAISSMPALRRSIARNCHTTSASATTSVEIPAIRRLARRHASTATKTERINAQTRSKPSGPIRARISVFMGVVYARRARRTQSSALPQTLRRCPQTLHRLANYPESTQTTREDWTLQHEEIEVLPQNSPPRRKGGHGGTVFRCCTMRSQNESSPLQ